VRTLHVGLRVSDLDRSLRFYEALGYEVVGRVPDTEFGSLTMLQLPGDDVVSIELVHDPAGGPVGGGPHHLVVQVEDLRATVASLAAQGVDASSPGSPDGSEDFLSAWLTDPDGCRIELVQWPAGHAVGLTRADFPQSPPVTR
jgi:lactoylglutathione lyase